MTTQNKPRCQLVGTDGNVYALAARVSVALRTAHQYDKADEFADKLKKCKSYDEALALMQEYVDAY